MMRRSFMSNASSRYPFYSGALRPPISSSSTSGSVYLNEKRYPSSIGCLTAVRMSASAKLSRYFRRLVHVSQMDFELALWQMLYLMIHPQKVYKNFMYRKKSKDQWARDDPAFLVLLAVSLAISSVFFSIILNLGFGGFILFFLWAVFVDCIFVGICVATVNWFFSNRYLRNCKDQDVEWGYCFDVHLNAFFPLLMMLHVVLPVLFYAFIDYPYFFSRLFGNAIWFIATVYYTYITFLGYTALPILHKTHVFLYPITFLLIFYIASVSAGWNISQTAMNFYHFRVMSRTR